MNADELRKLVEAVKLDPGLEPATVVDALTPVLDQVFDGLMVSGFRRDSDTPFWYGRGDPSSLGALSHWQFNGLVDRIRKTGRVNYVAAGEKRSVPVEEVLKQLGK